MVITLEKVRKTRENSPRTRRIRQLARQRKVKNQGRMAQRQIDKKKYYGVGVEVDRYEDLMKDVVDMEEVEKALQLLDTGRESVRTENLVDQILNQINDVDDFFDNRVIAKLGGVLERSFEKGAKRVLTMDGDKLEVPDVKDTEALNRLMEDQKDYFKNLSEDAKNTIRDELRQGFDEGESIPELKNRITDEVEQMTKNRAETTARSEVIKASAKGTDASMEKAGVEEVVWLATLDKRVCETCEDLHESKWSRSDPNRPMPVEDTHPNCRCTFVAVIGEESLSVAEVRKALNKRIQSRGVPA